MKYRLVRFVSFSFAVIFIVWSATLFTYDIRHYNRFLQIEFRKYMARDAVTLVFGIFCLVRYCHWHRKALMEKHEREKQRGRQAS